MDIGDKVVRKSHGRDLTFEIIDIIEKEERTICMLVGCNMRIIADSSIDDLEKYYTAKVDVNKGVPSPIDFVYYYKDKIRKMI